MKTEQKESSSTEKNSNNGSKKKIFFWIFLAVGILLLLILLFSGFSFWLLIYVIMWFFFLKFSWKFANSGTASWKIMIGAGIGVIILSLIFVVLVNSGSKEKDDREKNKPNSTSSSSELKKYDGKIFELKSEDGKFNGLVALTFKEEKKKDYLSASYNLKIKDDLKVNGKCPYNPNGCEGHIEYVYSNDLLDIKATSNEKDDEGGLLSVFCNKEAEFDKNNASESQSRLFNCSPDSNGYKNHGKITTDTFSAHFTKNFYSVEDFLATNQFSIYDASDFVYEEKIDDTSSSWGADHQKAVTEGKKVAEYTFKINEVQN